MEHRLGKTGMTIEQASCKTGTMRVKIKETVLFMPIHSIRNTSVSDICQEIG